MAITEEEKILHETLSKILEVFVHFTRTPVAKGFYLLSVYGEDSPKRSEKNRPYKQLCLINH